MSLTDTNLRYLFTIYEIAKTKMDVSSKEVARALAVTKPSVVRVLDALTRRSLVVKERYGKIYLTDRGAFTVRYYNALIETVLQNFPDFGFAITEEQRRAAAFAMAADPFRHLPVADRTSRNITPDLRRRQRQMFRKLTFSAPASAGHQNHFRHQNSSRTFRLKTPKRPGRFSGSNSITERVPREGCHRHIAS